MKKCIIFVLLISILLLPGCALLELPGMLLQQVVPMVIQYAPYALMFIEETNEKTIAENNLELFYCDLHTNIPKSPHNLNELSASICESLAQKNKKIQSVYILNLQNVSEQELTAFYTKLSKQGKIHHRFVKLNHLQQTTNLPLQTPPIYTAQLPTPNIFSNN